MNNENTIFSEDLALISFLGGGHGYEIWTASLG